MSHNRINCHSTLYTLKIYILFFKSKINGRKHNQSYLKQNYYFSCNYLMPKEHAKEISLYVTQVFFAVYVLLATTRSTVLSQWTFGST